MRKLLLVGLFLATLAGCGTEYYSTRWEVVEVIQCLGEDQYDAVCTIKAKRGDVVRTGRVSDFVYVGKTIYKVCWKEEEGDRCYTDFREYRQGDLL